MALAREFLEVADWLDAAYEALSVNDIDLFLTAFSPDARWNLQGRGAGLPFAGVKVGQAAIREMISAIHGQFKMRDFFIEDIVANRESAAVRWSAMATSIATGRQIQLEVFDHIVIKDGKIASLTQFFDSAAIAATASNALPALQGAREAAS
jgi:ketosteroid isomerase-like protein